VSEPVPILLVTGALGAGKTTLINAMLQAGHGRRLAAIVNDFGSINIDEVLLSGTGKPVYGLKNGCICCSLQGDLLRTIHSVLTLDRAIDGIVIEASGVSDPRGIIAALHDPVLHQSIHLDSVIAVVDAEDRDWSDPLRETQVQAADFVVMSKVDDAVADAAELLRARLRHLRKTSIFTADAAAALPFELFLAGSPRRDRHSVARSFLHQADDRFVEFEWSSESAVSAASFQTAIARLAPELLRAKGFLSFEDRPDERFLFQLVGRRASLLPIAAAPPGIQLVLIGRVGALEVDRAKAILHAM
jgi:G3E family GTPase